MPRFANVSFRSWKYLWRTPISAVTIGLKHCIFIKLHVSFNQLNQVIAVIMWVRWYCVCSRGHLHFIWLYRRMTRVHHLVAIGISASHKCYIAPRLRPVFTNIKYFWILGLHFISIVSLCNGHRQGRCWKKNISSGISIIKSDQNIRRYWSPSW